MFGLSPPKTTPPGRFVLQAEAETNPMLSSCPDARLRGRVVEITGHTLPVFLAQGQGWAKLGSAGESAEGRWADLGQV